MINVLASGYIILVLEKLKHFWFSQIAGQIKSMSLI